METSLAELILLAAGMFILYHVLHPVQVALERFLLRFFDHREQILIDAERVAEQARKKRKE